MPWRELACAFPQLVKIDVECYAAVLDAVDQSVSASQAAHGKDVLMSPFGWGMPVIQDSRVVRVETYPIAPVRASDPALVLIACLQRLALNRAALWAGAPLAESAGVFYVLRTMAEKALKRRLIIKTDIAADLIKFAVLPSANQGDAGYDEFLFPIIKHIERSVQPPAPAALQEQLQVLSAKLSRLSAEQVARQKKFKQRPSTKRLDQARDRIDQLASNAPY